MSITDVVLNGVVIAMGLFVIALAITGVIACIYAIKYIIEGE